MESDKEIKQLPIQPMKRKGPCCVCKETKNLRDECIRFKSEEECIKEFENHKKCLIEQGFKV